MRIYDISIPLKDGIPIYPGDPGLEIQDWLSLSNGDTANVSMVHFGVHTGTHVDAPAHFIEGAARVEAMPLEILIGEAEVIEVPRERRSIDAALVREHCPNGSKRVLFKTRNSSLWTNSDSSFNRDYTYLECEAAKELLQRGVRLVGIDYLSIEKYEEDGHPTHLALLSKDVVIVEGLNLRDVPAGKYELICLPLRISGGKGDGAPARAVLRTVTN
jgi:arylformamidase